MTTAGTDRRCYTLSDNCAGDKFNESLKNVSLKALPVQKSPIIIQTISTAHTQHRSPHYHMKIKLGTILALAFIGLGSATLTAQEVTLGDNTFPGTSDKVPADWYHPMRIGTNTLEGHGEKEGGTISETCTLGEALGGVKCLRRQVVISSPGSTDVTEDWWLAVDSLGDIRVLKCSGTNLAAYDAFESGSAPLFLPGDPEQGQTWELFGRTQTVVSVVESGFGGNLVVKSEADGTETQTSLYWAGLGLSSFTKGTSQWIAKPPTVAPAGE